MPAFPEHRQETICHSLSFNLNEGSYKIHIYDENGLCDINTEFTVGDKFKGKKEKVIGMITFLFGVRFLIIPFWIFLFIIIFPFKPELNFNIVKSIELYIEGNINVINIKKGLLYLYLVILSPFILRHRYQVVENILKYSIFVAFIYPLVLPIHFFSHINGIVGYSFFIFVVMGSKTTYDHWSLQMTYIYYGTIVFAYVFFASGKKYYKKNSFIVLIINSIITIILFGIAFIINFITVAQSISFVFLFFTTAFIIIWAVLLGLFIKFYKFK